jgi:hypothetical protein
MVHTPPISRGEEDGKTTGRRREEEGKKRAG